MRRNASSHVFYKVTLQLTWLYFRTEPPVCFYVHAFWTLLRACRRCRIRNVRYLVQSNLVTMLTWPPQRCVRSQTSMAGWPWYLFRAVTLAEISCHILSIDYRWFLEEKSNIVNAHIYCRHGTGHGVGHYLNVHEGTVGLQICKPC